MSISVNDSGIVVATARSERADAVDLVRGFMESLAQQDLAAASRGLAAGFRMVISGGHEFAALADFLAFSRKRYAAVRKHIDGIEACEAPVGVSVYLTGTMSGQWLDGTPFERVRFCDRFLVRDARILELHTWSDLAEFRPR